MAFVVHTKINVSVAVFTVILEQLHVLGHKRGILVIVRRTHVKYVGEVRRIWLRRVTTGMLWQVVQFTGIGAPSAVCRRPL